MHEKNPKSGCQLRWAHQNHPGPKEYHFFAQARMLCFIRYHSGKLHWRWFASESQLHWRKNITLWFLVNNYFVPPPKVKEKDSNSSINPLSLTKYPARSMLRSLERYRQAFPAKNHYELTQSISRARTTLKNGELPCLATSSTHVWSEVLKRTFSGHEKLRTLGYPVDKMSWTRLHTENGLSKMAGNGMCIPNVGWAMLVHRLCITPVHEWVQGLSRLLQFNWNWWSINCIVPAQLRCQKDARCSHQNVKKWNGLELKWRA